MAGVSQNQSLDIHSQDLRAMNVKHVLLVLSCLSPFHSVQGPAHELDPPWVDLPVSINRIKKTPHKHAHR